MELERKEDTDKAFERMMNDEDFKNDMIKIIREESIAAHPPGDVSLTWINENGYKGYSYIDTKAGHTAFSVHSKDKRMQKNSKMSAEMGWRQQIKGKLYLDRNKYDTSSKKRKRKMWIILALIVGCFFIITCVILPPSTGKVAPILDEDGKVLECSIAEKVFVEINGVEQGMFIKGKDKEKPVLLLVHGGPGMSDYFLAKEYPTNLEDEFVVCYWEQRGTGLSYSADIAPETMTTEQFLSDAIAVTNYLRERFGQEKIYLMGHSWGTYTGIQAAAEASELYYAYIAMSQIVDQPKSERLSYTYMLKQYTSSGNARMAKKFERYPILESDEALKEYRTSLLRDEAMHDLGVGTMHNMKSVITGIFSPTLRCTDYTPMERLNIWRGKAFSGETGLRDEQYSFNAFSEVPTLEIPVYFFAGCYDYTCCYSLQKEYYEQMQAPVKGFYTFNESAHSPVFEEPEKAMNIMRRDVLNGIVTLSDQQ